MVIEREKICPPGRLALAGHDLNLSVRKCSNLFLENHQHELRAHGAISRMILDRI